MLKQRLLLLLILVFALGLPAMGQMTGVTNVAFGKPTKASSEMGSDTADKAVDGIWDSNDHRWRSNPENDPPHWLEIDLEKMYVIHAAEVHTGTIMPDGTYRAAVRNFSLQYKVDGEWVDIPGATVVGNPLGNGIVKLEFDQPITTSKVRFYSMDGRGTEVVRVLEIMIFGVPADGED